jgi:peptidoglycan/xylan/chitin deacetylase (PgdA/CDA1 family)
MRRWAKSTLCHAVAWARAQRWAEERQPVILGYHRVVADAALADAMPGLAIGVAMLEQHLDWIGRRCRFVTLDELAAGGDSEPLAAVTFDDGYADVVDHALPLLRRKGIPGAIFAVTDAAASGAPLLHDRLYRALAWLASIEGTGAGRAYTGTRSLLGRLGRAALEDVIEELEREAGEALAAHDDDARPLDFPALRRLRDEGWTIGSHTRSHARLVGRHPDRLRDELHGSRQDLELHLGAPVRHFAYPDGQFDPAVVEAVAEAGYTYAYTACRHRDPARPLLTIPRAMLWEQSSLGGHGRFSGDVLTCQAHGGLPFLDRCHRSHGDFASAA